MLLMVFIYAAVLNFSEGNSVSNNPIRIKRSDDSIPCENGWYYFNEKCYKVDGGESSSSLKWEKAAEKCQSYGGDLVSILSEEEQDFIITFLLLDVKRYSWIGLHDRDKESDHKWNDGFDLNYTNWNKYEPTGDTYGNEDCVLMLYEPEKDVVGKWNDDKCDEEYAYICKMNTTTEKKSPNMMYCSSEEGGGWKYQDSCYHIVNETKSWENAEKHCKDNYHGHLVTIWEKTVDLFLEYILSNIKEDMWIGIKIQNQMQQKWTSDWFVTSDLFDKVVEESEEGTCAFRRKRKDWIADDCSHKHLFICETSKVSPPVLKSPAKTGHCPEEFFDWRDLGGEFCYYFERKKFINWYQARSECARRKGNLLSLHSKEETDVLSLFVKYAPRRFFIGLYRPPDKEDGQFAWTDGSAIDYENWRHGEPSSVKEKCVEVNTRDMKWNDVNCADLQSYICSVKKVTSTSTTVQKTSSHSVTSTSTTAQKTSFHSVTTSTTERKTTPKIDATTSTSILKRAPYADTPVSTVQKTSSNAVTSNSTAVAETGNNAMTPTSTAEENSDQYRGYVSIDVLIGVTIFLLLVIILLLVVMYRTRRRGFRKQSMTPLYLPNIDEKYSNAVELTTKDDAVYEDLK